MADRTIECVYLFRVENVYKLYTFIEIDVLRSIWSDSQSLP